MHSACAMASYSSVSPKLSSMLFSMIVFAMAKALAGPWAICSANATACDSNSSGGKKAYCCRREPYTPFFCPLDCFSCFTPENIGLVDRLLIRIFVIQRIGHTPSFNVTLYLFSLLATASRTKYRKKTSKVFAAGKLPHDDFSAGMQQISDGIFHGFVHHPGTPSRITQHIGSHAVTFDAAVENDFRFSPLFRERRTCPHWARQNPEGSNPRRSLLCLRY